MPNGDNKNLVIEETYKLLNLGSSGVKYEEFAESLKRPEVMQETYSILSLEDEGVSIEEFSESLGLGKLEEVSGQGSQNTSKELPEPSKTSQEDNLNTELQIGIAQTEDIITLPDGAVAIPDSSGGFIIPDEENPEDLSMGEYYNPIQPVEVTATIEDGTTVGGRIYNSFMSALNSFNEGLVATPEFLNAFSVAVINLPSEALSAIGMEDLAESIRLDPENTWNILTTNNMGLRALAELSDYYARNSEAYRQQLPEDYGNIENSIRQGNYLRAGEELVSGILNSAPSVITLAMTGGLGASTSISSIVGQTFIKTLPFSATNYRELQREGVDVPNGLLPVYSAMNGMVEILDANIGASSFLRREIMAGRMKSEGVQDFITGYLSKSFKENGIPFAILRGSASEGIVQLSHNIIDKYSGIDPDRGLMDNVANGMIIGGGMSGSIVSIGKLGNAISNKTNRDRVNTLESEINSLKENLENTDKTDTKEAIQELIETKTDEINEIITKSESEQANLTEEELNEVIKENNKETSIKEDLESENNNLTDDVKEMLTEDVPQETQETVTEEQVTQAEDTQPTETVQSEEVFSLAEQTAKQLPDRTTIFESLTDTDKRQSRISELENRLKQQWEDSKKLGIESDPKNKAQQDLEFLRDLTEYAVLKIADGTVKTAKAFQDLARGIGDFGNDVLNRAYNEAKTIAKEYVDTNPERSSMDAGQSEVLTRMQDVTRDRTKAKTKVKKSTIKKVTDKGTTGQVTKTTKQAFRDHYRTLAKGFREGVKEGKRQTKEQVQQRAEAISKAREGITDFVQAWAKDKGLKGAKVSGTVLNSLVNRLNNAKTPKQLENFADYFERTMDKTKEGVRKAHIRKTQSKLRRQARQKGMAQEVAGLMRMVANTSLSDMTPEQLYDFNLFANSVNDILVSEQTISNETISDWKKLIQDMNRDRQKDKTDKLIEKLEEAGVETKVIEELAKQHVNSKGEINIETLNNNLSKLYEATVESDGEIKLKKADKLRKVAKTLKEEIDADEFDFTEAQKNDLQDILDIDLTKLPDKNLIELVSGLRALQLSGKMVGMAQVLAKARKYKTLADTKAVSNFKKNLRLPRWLSRSYAVDMIKKKLGIVPQRTYSLTKYEKELDEVLGFMGLSQYSMGTNRTKYRINEMIGQLDELMKQHMKDLTNPIEQAKLAMYKLLAVEHDPSWTDVERAENIRLFKEGIRLSIEGLEKSAKLDRIGGKDKTEYISNLKKSYDQIKGYDTADGVYESLSKGAKALSDYMNNSFRDISSDSEYVANMAGTKATTFSKENYFPIVYETTSVTERRAEQKDISEMIGARPMSNRDASGKVVSDGMMHDVKLKGDQLPRGRVYNFNVISNFINEISDQIYTIETNSDIRYLAEMLSSTEVEDILGNSNLQTLMREIANNKVNVDQLSLTLPKDTESRLLRAWQGITRKGAEMALAGLGQAGKQAFPVVGDAMGRTVFNPERAFNSSKDAVKIANYIEYNSLREEILKNSTIGHRSMQELYGVETGTRALKLAPKSRRGGLLSWMKRGERGLAKTAMKTMIVPDELATRASLYAYYAEYLRAKGIELTPDSKLHRGALVYAENKVERIANTTDSSLMPIVLRNTYVKNAYAFVSFSLNSHLDALANIKRIVEAGYDLDGRALKESFSNLIGNLVNVVAFQAVGALLREGYIEIKGVIADTISKFIEDNDEDDSEETKELKEFLANYEDILEKDKEENRIMSSVYAFQDLLFRGAGVGAGDEVTKYLSTKIMDKVGLLNEEQRKVVESKTRYSPDEIESIFKVLGTTGMFMDNVYSFGKNVYGTAVDMDKEKFQEKYYAKETAEGTDWVVPNEAKGKALNHSIGMLQIAGRVLEATRFVFPLQETQAVQRRSDALARQLKRHAYGTGKRKDIDQLSALKSLVTIKVDGEDYILNEEQLKWALKHRQKLYNELYKEWKPDWDKNESGDFEDFARKKINEITREDIKDKYIDHLKIHQGELDERRKRKLETIVREYIKERQKNGKK